MKKARVQYTIRDVPRSVDAVLRERAQRQRRSLNEVAIEALQSGAGLGRQVRYDDLEFFFGSWVDDPAVDKALKDQRRIDPEDWK